MSPLRVQILCPLDGLSITLPALDTSKTIPGDGDGDFKRDPTQHVHLGGLNADVACANGHRWTLSADLVLARRP
jgi:hypothetical protein